MTKEKLLLQIKKEKEKIEKEIKLLKSDKQMYLELNL